MSKTATMHRDTTRRDVYEAIDVERDRQDAKWGPQRNLTPLLWSAVLGEEVGEAARAVLDLGARRDQPSPELCQHEEAVMHLREELVQVAAVAVAWLERLSAEAGCRP